MMSETAPKVQKRGWWARKSTAAKALLVSGAVVVGGFFLLTTLGLVLVALGVEAPEDEPVAEPVEVTEVAEEPSPEPTEPDPEPTTEEQSPDPTTPEPEPATEEPSPEPEPEPQSPEDALQEALTDAVDTAQLVHPSEEILETEFRVSDNFTMGWIRGVAQQNTIDILRAVTASDFDPDEISIVGRFPMVDQYGNEDPDSMVLVLNYERETVDQIDFDGIRSENIWEVADLTFVHPAFQEDDD